MTIRRRSAHGRSVIAGVLALGTAAVAVTAGKDARAQQQTFHLDRLEVPGSPDDGFVLFRPYTRQNTIFFAQLGLGYSLKPLRMSDITNDRGILSRSSSGLIQDQFTSYANIGFELLDRVILAASLPVTWVQDGNNPNYGQSTFLSSTGPTVETSGPAAGDTRVDLRGVILRTEDRKGAFGARGSLFFPTGTTSNFGGDGQTTFYLGVDGEYTIKFITLVAETGVDFRPDNTIGRPSLNGGDNRQGLGVANEWRWAVGAFIPIKRNKYRIGATIWGQTGLASDDTVGNTVFTTQNTQLEWLAEGRMKFGPANHWWWGLGAGTRILQGYGGPDFRAVGMIGAYVPILESEANSPEGKLALRQKWRHEASQDSDHDGIPDDIDACPTEAEDHQGADPEDGCPMPPDRDGDGIPDQYDKCPDQPEDKDGIDDTDGCPEDDADSDGVPDATDACPKEPGAPNPDPKKNGCPQFIHLEGSVVRVLQQVHFATASTTILPDSFPMLQEIANLLKANPQIKHMSIDGHTDDRGDAAMNQRLSQGRATSVMNWLVEHGIAADRLEAHGYGEEKPIADNSTAEGRAANRRVEFKITEEDTGPQKPQPKKPQPSEEQPRDEGDIDQ